MIRMDANQHDNAAPKPHQLQSNGIKRKRLRESGLQTADVSLVGRLLGFFVRPQCF